MDYVNAKCMPGEIFLGEYLEKAVEKFDRNLMVRVEKAYNRGVNKYFNVYVLAKELSNFLRQYEIDLEEERGNIYKKKRAYELLSILPKLDLRDETVFDEVFIGFYPNASCAKLAFSFFDSIRGGSLAEYETMKFYDDRGQLKEPEAVPMYYFFADGKEFSVYLQEMRENLIESCEDYKFMKMFYEEMKQYEGG